MKKAQHKFSETRAGEGGQRPFGIFPKIHPNYGVKLYLTVDELGNVPDHLASLLYLFLFVVLPVSVKQKLQQIKYF